MLGGIFLKNYIIALDQGTTSSRAIIFDQNQNIVDICQKEFEQIYPQPGFVEHDPNDIYSSLYSVMMEVITHSGISLDDIAGIGITNQRETTIVWNKETGLPVCNAIVWQCRRTASICEELNQAGFGAMIKEKTGLLIDAYFSGTKIKWIFDHVPGARELAEEGKLLFGTVDTYVIWRMTNGQLHITDYTNASRTMLFNIKTLQWDKEICDLLEVPMGILPEVRNSSEIYGHVNISGHSIPIAAIAGDQQAALFGQACFHKGEAKNTYGTGCFLLINTGEELHYSKNGLITTIAIGLDGKVQYALEGSVFVGGALVKWLQEELGIIKNPKEFQELAMTVKDSGGVYIVPAFTGLGAPYWDMYARGSIFGITRGTSKAHICKAAEEAIAYQTNDLIVAIEADTNIKLELLNVDGGVSANDSIMEFQANITNTIVQRPVIRETTALGVAYLAGLATGVWKDCNEILAKRNIDQLFKPTMDEEVRNEKLSWWNKAVSRATNWDI